MASKSADEISGSTKPTTDVAARAPEDLPLVHVDQAAVAVLLAAAMPVAADPADPVALAADAVAPVVVAATTTTAVVWVAASVAVSAETTVSAVASVAETPRQANPKAADEICAATSAASRPDRDSRVPRALLQGFRDSPNLAGHSREEGSRPPRPQPPRSMK